MNRKKPHLRIILRLEESGKSHSLSLSFGGPGRILAGSIFLLSFISLFLLFQPDRLSSGETNASRAILPSHSSLVAFPVQAERELSRAIFLSRQLSAKQRTIHGLMEVVVDAEDLREQESRGVESGRATSDYAAHLREGDATALANLQFAGLYESLFEYLPYRWPLLKGSLRITSPYGYRAQPFFSGHGSEEFHPGLDLRAAMGDPVVATAPGTVAEVERGYGGYGNMVRIVHPSGYSTLYAHLSAILVKRGEVVRAKQVIGLAGETGKATGPHLHYEIKHGSERIDPDRILAL